ncbi:nucleotide-diphospho-sugar transferase [Runella aurantiaca]|uniref:Nucleotide-diphospho-sugar transferase n=1 Tax=Runella aurantiaca TaxID=2282308 RepID=A0A369I610_9BACT|nr:nucleotide-diphospho-sugar transferase [Runella aurantiaca]RDB04340.1 nucleotide-diphospho-sugar transferase [Runella aurantiaca]
MSFSTPILFIIFNKIEETKKVFEVIRQQRPAQLFIAADGPRPTKEGEKEKCDYIKNWVVNNIDWPCVIKTLFREQNVGCGKGPSEAVTWFFEHVQEGIILEDDCLPNDTFFGFCADLLDKYRDDEQVSIVSGNNFQLQQPMPLTADYYFSVFPSSNGWATWRRSWQGFDYHITYWEKLDKKDFIKFLFEDKEHQQWWKQQFDWIHRQKPDDMWDFQFHFLCMSRRQLAVMPKANLVKNIGYGPDATHSQDPDNYFANMPTYELNFPLTHPERIERNYEADVFIQDMLFGREEVVSNFKKMKRLIKRLIKYTPR